MLRLKANKTSLYKLVSEYEKLPPMRRVQFAKAPRRPDYWLEWADESGLRCKAFFMTALRSPLLAIEKKEFGGVQVSRMVHAMDAKNLLERGMMEEFMPAAERRRAERSEDNGAV